MNTKEILELASRHLEHLPGRTFDTVNIGTPSSLDEAVTLAKLYKITSKVSSLVGNLIEYDAAEYLNSYNDYNSFGKWIRQDPGFPDIILNGNIYPTPGFEVKAWYPFSTEITGRFKDSQNHFLDNQTNVMLLAWLPEYIIYGKPILIDILIVSGSSVANARDTHYHKPPRYLVLEPEDTSGRTSNLQQTNTNGYIFQEDGSSKIQEATEYIRSFGDDFNTYNTAKEYQNDIRELMGNYKYRLDTNYAKIDRINHPEIEYFKSNVLNTVLHGRKIKDWFSLLSKGTDEEIRNEIEANIPF